MTDANRRKHERRGVSLNRLIESQIVIDEHLDESLLYLVDISQGGLRVNSDKPFPEGRPFSLVLNLEPFSSLTGLQLAEVQFEASVVWQREVKGGTWVAGLEFHDLIGGAQEFVTWVLKDLSQQNVRSQYRLKKLVGLEIEVGEDVTLYPLTIDISSDGLRVISNHALEAGSNYPIRLFLRNNLPTVEAQATVVWQEPRKPNKWLIGFRFSEISVLHSQYLEEFIRLCLLEDLQQEQ